MTRKIEKQTILSFNDAMKLIKEQQRIIENLEFMLCTKIKRNS